MVETLEFTVDRRDLCYWRTGDRITWEKRPSRYRRIWNWLMRRNWRVAGLDLEREILTVRRAR